MKQIILPLLIFTVFFSCSSKKTEVQEGEHFRQRTQVVTDSIFTKVRIDSLTLCYSTLTDLKTLGFTFKSSNMDNEDSLVKEFKRHGEEFFIDTTNNLLVGTFSDSEIINSVWLLPNYKGSIIGTEISLEDYTVRQMLQDFPEFEWSTTGASKFWHYTNGDTTVFYIKVDPSIDKFPLNEEHYLDSRIEAVKSELSCWKLYGPQFAKSDTVLIKPLYAPISDTHMNYYLFQRDGGLHTTIKEITSAGKKSNFNQVRIGKWMNFKPDHSLESVEHYNNGKLVSNE